MITTTTTTTNHNAASPQPPRPLPSQLATIASPSSRATHGHRCWTRVGRTLNSVYKITDFLLQKRIQNDTRPLFAVQSVSEGRIGPAPRAINICKFVDQKAFTPTFSRANGERVERSKGGGQRRSYGGIKGRCSSVKGVVKVGTRESQESQESQQNGNEKESAERSSKGRNEAKESEQRVKTSRAVELLVVCVEVGTEGTSCGEAATPDEGVLASCKELRARGRPAARPGRGGDARRR